jgi:hypothetical protein
MSEIFTVQSLPLIVLIIELRLLRPQQGASRQQLCQANRLQRRPVVMRVAEYASLMFRAGTVVPDAER